MELVALESAVPNLLLNEDAVESLRSLGVQVRRGVAGLDS
jgi:hypothetical protein